MGNGTTKIRFRRRDGPVVPLTIDNDLKSVLDRAKERNKKNWDYLSIVAGIPGVGKSTFANNTLAPYCCPWFSEKYIAFTDEQFINITTKCPNYSSVVLDESFAPLNSRLIFTPEFQRIVNHIQLIRQKRLHLFLCLPNFFDLAKGIAIFRSSHLFVPYEDRGGERGQFLAFGRNEKRMLFVLGSKFMDYQATPPNFHGRYFKNGLVVNDEVYNKMKLDHFMSQNKKLSKNKIEKYDLGEIFYKFMTELNISQPQLASIYNIKQQTISYYVQKHKKRLEDSKTSQKQATNISLLIPSSKKTEETTAPGIKTESKMPNNH